MYTGICMWIVIVMSLVLIRITLLGNAISQHKTWSTVVQLMACCLMAPSHYHNQYRLTLSEVSWKSDESNFIVCSTVGSGVHQVKIISDSLWGDSLCTGPVIWKLFPCHDAFISAQYFCASQCTKNIFVKTYHVFIWSNRWYQLFCAQYFTILLVSHHGSVSKRQTFPGHQPISTDLIDLSIW